MSQNNAILPPQGTLRIYGAGGAGINIVGSWNADAGTIPGPGTAQIELAYIDTSRSNLPVGVDPKLVFVLEGVDGSGKVRAENHVEIGRNIRNVIQQHEAGDLNVVVFSASGGSGSVFGPLVIGELIERGQPVVGIVIGSEESNITAKNTLNTLKSLQAIAEKKGVPVVISYLHNERNGKRSNNDTRARYLISTLAMLASRRNHALDTKDLIHFFNFSKVTTVGTQLALLHVYNNPDDVDAASNPIAIASLMREPDQVGYTITPEYETTGYPLEAIETFDQLHFVITIDGLQAIIKNLTGRIDEVTKLSAARVKHDSIVTSSDNVTDDGLVL